MTSLDLSLACGEYDLTTALETGAVSPTGISLNVLHYPSPERHWRMIENQEFDVCEMSLGSYLASRPTADEYPFTAIPVFPHRRFRHSYMFRHGNADIDTPANLAGKCVGVKNWQNTAGIWMRGIAADQYGLDLESVSWYVEVSEDVPFSMPKRYDANYLDADENLERMLVDGEIDGAFHPVLLPAVKSGQPGAERIFEDSLAVEQAYYEETGIFPLMHTVVVRDAVLDEHPWVAVDLFDAFAEARDSCLEKLEDPRWTALAWARQHLEHQQAVLGDNPWPYGLTDENSHALDTFQRYAHEQGLIPHPYGHEELFVTSTLKESARGQRNQMGAKIRRSE